MIYHKSTRVRTILFFAIMFLVLSAGQQQRKAVTVITQPLRDSLQLEIAWVDSMLASMSLDQKIGQLFMIRAHSNLGADHIKNVEQQIARYHVGGLCFFQGTASKQLELTNKYQSLSSVPLFVSMDAEWGLAMRLKDSIIQYPRNLMLGAIQQNDLLYEYGRAHASELKRLGVHINFGPVVDINNNRSNPVINDRSFGEDKFNVVTKAYLYMIGLQDEGLIACAKHFPGHGDTRVDSHYDLPVISHSLARLEQTELFPFELLADNGLQSMMVAHVHLPALDSTPNIPATLSPAIVDTLLKQKIGFKGLIFTDALEMKGVTKHFKPGNIEVMAVNAGNDILLLPENIELGFKAVKNAVTEGTIPLERIEYSVRKILAFKYRMGLSTKQIPISKDNLFNELNEPVNRHLKENLISGALTLVKDHNSLIPVLHDPDIKTLIIEIGDENFSDFYSTAAKYIYTDILKVENNPSSAKQEEILKLSRTYDRVILAVFSNQRLPKDRFGINTNIVNLAGRISEQDNSICVLFGNPYGLAYFEGFKTLIAAYENEPSIHQLCAQAIFGARAFSGKLPVTVSTSMPLFAGLNSTLSAVLSQGMPESVGMNSKTLAGIDAIAAEMIKIQASPGGQVLAIKDNTVIFHKAYGHHDYTKERPVTTEDVYDIASITKVAATTIALMKLYEDGLLDINNTLGDYLPFLKGSDKEKIKIKDVLIHRAGLFPWIPFYRHTLVSSQNPGMTPDTNWYSNKPLPGYQQVANSLYLNAQYQDTIIRQIRDSELLPDKPYKYSDLGFILMKWLINEVSGMPMDEYVDKHFYRPLGLRNTTYNPLDKNIPLSRIIPTEKDSYFRNQLLDGHVHDMAAAMLGGVSGHAGLFSNAYELGVLFSMLVNNGFYGGHSYLKKETIDFFTTRPKGESRRGLGFDMIQLQKGKAVNVTGLASSRTFGHTGFTGTCVWADPECNIVYVFLSNRVNPSMENTRLNDYQYRLRIHYLIYKSMDE